MLTVATPCNDIIECVDATDEESCNDESLCNIILGVTSGVFLLIYILLMFGRYVRKCKKGRRNHVFLHEYYDEVIIRFRMYFQDKNIIDKTNAFLLQILFCESEKKKKEIGIQFFDFLHEICGCKEAETYLYLHKHMDPLVSKMVIEAKYPGLSDKIRKLKCGKWITELMDKFSRREKLQRIIYRIKKVAAMEMTYVDIFKDTAVSISILKMIGGIGALLDYILIFHCK